MIKDSLQHKQRRMAELEDSRQVQEEHSTAQRSAYLGLNGLCNALLGRPVISQLKHTLTTAYTSNKRTLIQHRVYLLLVLLLPLSHDTSDIRSITYPTTSLTSGIRGYDLDPWTSLL